ncbi:hypothetical protein ACQ3G6_06945 [Allorhizobium undicola]|uniref:hypothetical protein n=1 Tax=Allorhizobium undicola TaxID=78527 RepID=UPI0004891707|nr:hypothetical protein [Allorhizobium undicola]
MSNPLSKFIRDLVQSIRAEFAERRRHKQARRLPAAKADQAAEKKVVVTRASNRSKSARQARRITRNRG